MIVQTDQKNSFPIMNHFPLLTQNPFAHPNLNPNKPQHLRTCMKPEPTSLLKHYVRLWRYRSWQQNNFLFKKQIGHIDTLTADLCAILLRAEAQGRFLLVIHFTWCSKSTKQKCPEDFAETKARKSSSFSFANTQRSSLFALISSPSSMIISTSFFAALEGAAFRAFLKSLQVKLLKSFKKRDCFGQAKT